MSGEGQDARHPIRHSIDELAGVAETGRIEIGDLADSALTALHELTRATTAALPRDEALELEAELRHIADGMRTATQRLQYDVVAAIESETAALEELLRPEAETITQDSPLDVHETGRESGQGAADEVIAERTDGGQQNTRREPRNNWERARQAFLDHADEIDDLIDVFTGTAPKIDPPQAPSGSEVDDPISAGVLSIAIALEAAGRWREKRKG